MVLSLPFTVCSPHMKVVFSTGILLSFLVSAVVARTTSGKENFSFTPNNVAKLSLSLMATAFMSQMLGGNSAPTGEKEVNDDKSMTFREDGGFTKLVPLIPERSTTKTKNLKKYTMKEVATKNTADELWIVIHGRVYDVTKFMDKHPGGHFVILNLGGKDATDAFENYHQARITKTMLPAYLIGECVDVPSYPHVEDFRAIQQELLRRGLYEVDRRFYVKLYTWFACIFASSLYCTLMCTSMTAHMIGAVLMGFFWQQTAGVGHDLGHSTVHQNFHFDHLLGSSLFGALMGISTCWWKRSHNTHHVHCNSVEHDPDIQHLPVIAQNEQIIHKPYFSTYHEKIFKMDSIARFLVSYQHIIFIPLMMVARFNLYAQSWIMLLTQGGVVYNRRVEYVCLSFFLVWVLAVALSLPTWFESVAWVLISHFCAGFLHIQIIISHWASETYHGSAFNDASDEWYAMQIKTTLNVDCPVWLDWLHIGLQHQTEHHMFPLVPRHNLRQVRTMVKEVCKKHNITYYELGFFDAVMSNIRHLKQVAMRARAGEEVSTEFLADFMNAQG